MSNINIDPEDEALFREVDEEMRQERLKELWDKFGVYIIGGALALIAIVGGGRYMAWQSEQAAANSGANFLQATELMKGEKTDAATQLYQKIAKGGSAGYQTLANLRLGALEASKGNSKDALTVYDRVAANSSADPIFQDFAKVQAAMLRVDSEPATKIKSALQPIADSKSAWRFSALELIALAEYKAKNYKAALDIYARLRRETGVPQSMRERAGQMQAMLSVQIEEQKTASTKTPASDGDQKAAKDKK